MAGIMNFPIITVLPSGNFSQKASRVADAADIRTQTEAGYVVTRKRYTRVPDVFECLYWPLGDEDYWRLKLLVDYVGTSASFYWEHPVTKNPIEVRFLTRPSFMFEGINWKMQAEFEAV